ncbi:MAG: SAM-dependent methyltransferase [[Chlorobium] sp. 445]|nr:MAG: SAM-dependent methyltransferase [[Chlorobium] sp. 445]
MTLPHHFHQVRPTTWYARERLREKGQFWTPLWLAQAMVAYVLQESHHVFDPAIGRGAFLQAMGALHVHNLSYYGFDVDPTVLEDALFQQAGVIVEVRDFLAAPPQQRFAAIVANPPYIRHHRLPAPTKAMLQQRCKEITGFRLDGRTGYHVYFLLQALHLLQINGRLAFVVPADTAEGCSAPMLWQWITTQYCLEDVITFHPSAAPFPNVDTNALVVLIRNVPPKPVFWWGACHQPDGDTLREWMTTKNLTPPPTMLTVEQRSIQEALQTGLSRPRRTVTTQSCLGDFATVMRGIATGANDFFFLTRQQAQELKLPDDVLRIAVGRTRDVLGDELTDTDIERLDTAGRPTQLLALTQTDQMTQAIQDYLLQGIAYGLPQRALLKQRNPWYVMEQRRVPPILFAYLGRRNTRFIRNRAGALPLTSFLCVYPRTLDENAIDRLWQACNHAATLANLRGVAKSYGSGAIKVEPRSLERLPIPDDVVTMYGLREH